MALSPKSQSFKFSLSEKKKAHPYFIMWHFALSYCKHKHLTLQSLLLCSRQYLSESFWNSSFIWIWLKSILLTAACCADLWMAGWIYLVFVEKHLKTVCLPILITLKKCACILWRECLCLPAVVITVIFIYILFPRWIKVLNDN